MSAELLLWITGFGRETQVYQLWIGPRAPLQLLESSLYFWQEAQAFLQAVTNSNSSTGRVSLISIEPGGPCRGPEKQLRIPSARSSRSRCPARSTPLPPPSSAVKSTVTAAVGPHRSSHRNHSSAPIGRASDYDACGEVPSAASACRATVHPSSRCDPARRAARRWPDPVCRSPAVTAAPIRIP